MEEKELVSEINKCEDALAENSYLRTQNTVIHYVWKGTRAKNQQVYVVSSEFET